MLIICIGLFLILW